MRDLWRYKGNGNCTPDAEDRPFMPVQMPDEENPQRVSLAVAQLNRWMDTLERLRLAEYVSYVEDRRRLFRDSFVSGMVRGLGMAVGFTILGAVLVSILQDLARHNLPLIGELLEDIMNALENRAK